jgi:hypothetical protein
MKPQPALYRNLVLLLSAVSFACLPLQATVFQVDLSPLSGALNLGANPYTQDHAVGLSGLNSASQLSPTGSGNEVGAGISYDDVTNLLSFDFAYGSAFGFTDLVGNWTLAHIHGPGLVNFPAANINAGVQVGLGVFHTPSGSKSGRITGSTTLTAPQELLLIDNTLYVNIHSDFYPGGELRAQLILVPEPSTYALLASLAVLGVVAWRRRR